MKKLVLFASGTGSNVENIIRHFSRNPDVEIAAVITNNPQADVVGKAEAYGIPVLFTSRERLENGETLEDLRSLDPQLIVLAGFLLKFPASIVAAYPKRVVNIHPALLPRYGGKGMYGMNVHRAVLANKEASSGISVHYVNEYYDEGELIAQHAVNVEECASAEEIAAKVQQLEQRFFPSIIEQLLT